MKEIEKRRFEVMMRRHPNGSIEKAVFIGGEMLDYSIDVQSYLEACKMGPHFKIAVQRDIEKHFTESVSEFLGRRVTLDDIKEAIKTGWI
jgi:hypothetical protein